MREAWGVTNERPKQCEVRRRSGLPGALRGDIGDVNPGGAVVSRESWPVMSAQVGREPPRRLAGTERRRAKNVTQIVVWSTCGPKVMENIMYFEQSEK